MIKLKDLLEGKYYTIGGSEKSNPNAVLDEEGAQELAKRMNKEIKAPYVEASVSSLGGKTQPSVMLRVSLDPRNTWTGGIYHNSRGSMWDIDYLGSMEQHYLSLHPEPRPWTKFRKAKYKTHDEAIKKINAYIAKVL